MAKRRWRLRKASTGVLECMTCAKMLPLSAFNKRDCKWGVDYRCKECCDKRRRQWIDDHPEKHREHARTQWGRIKARVLEAYAGRYPACRCCGEKGVPFLTIDHVNGGGTKHIRSLRGGLYGWLIRNKFPEGFQVLCFNCNCAKRDTGICPHKR